MRVGVGGRGVRVGLAVGRGVGVARLAVSVLFSLAGDRRSRELGFGEAAETVVPLRPSVMVEPVFAPCTKSMPRSKITESVNLRI